MPTRILAGFLLLVAASTVAAQCAPVVVPGGAVAGVGGPYAGVGDVRASVLWDPDGAGPATALMVFGGSFSVAGSIAANNLVAVDPITGLCQPLGVGVVGAVQSLVVTPAGELLAGGQFQNGGQWLSPVLRWNGVQWVEIGAGQLSGSVNDMVVLANGDLVVGGNCVLTAFPNSWCVARWNGQAWLPMGAGFFNIVNDLVVLPNGDVVAGGEDYSVGYCARWNGSQWAAMGSGPGGRVFRFALTPAGTLFAVGQLATGLAQWNGSAWTSVATPGWQSANVRSIAVLPGGDLVLGGSFSQGTLGSYVLRSGGGTASWSVLGRSTSAYPAGLPPTHLAMLPNGDLIAGGSFYGLQGVGAVGVARWRNGAWESVTSGTAGQLLGAKELVGGDIVVHGLFRQIGGVQALHVARYVGNQWTALGTGTNGSITSAFVRANGDLWVSGSFTAIDGQPANGLAFWDGSSWTPVPNKYSASGAFLELPNGDLLAGVTTYVGSQGSSVSRWTGSTWQPVGQLTGQIRCLRRLPTGDLLAVGSSIPGWEVVRWNGAIWAGFGTPALQGVQDLLVGRDGTTYVARQTYSTGPPECVLRWSGTAWLPLAGLTGHSYSLHELPNGDVLASGSFQIAGVPAYRPARWNGTSWSWFGPDSANAMLVTSRGHVWLSTTSPFLNGGVTGFHARLEPSCPASTTSVGAGCTSSGGPVHLFADSRPWLGSTFRAIGTGIPASAIVFGVRGLTAQSVPLATVVPQGQPGCTLLASLDLLDVMLPIAGTTFTAIAIPNAMALVGQTMRYQLLPAQFDLAGNLAAVTSSNALQLTFGTL